MENQDEILYTPPFERRGFDRHLSDDRVIQVRPTTVYKHPVYYQPHEVEPCLDDVPLVILTATQNSAPSYDIVNQGEDDPLVALIIAGALAAAGGLATLGVYISKRSKEKKRLKEIAKTCTCTECKKSLADGTPNLPKKKGKSAEACIICPHCGYKNTETDMAQSSD